MIAAVPVELTDAALAAEVVDGLAQVETQLADAMRSEEELLAEASTHLLEAGGKRFRATLVLLAGQFGNPRDPRVVSAATAVELTHLATLYHDDVMDEALIRRGHESANSRWTNTIAILTGDFLFARASQMLAALGHEAVGIQADTFARLVGGQIAETIGPRPGQDPLQHYLHVVKDKTASLVATSGRFGAMYSDAPAEVVARIERPARRSGWPGSCLTTSSTWPVTPTSPARRRDRPARGRAQPAGALCAGLQPPGRRPAARVAYLR